MTLYHFNKANQGTCLVFHVREEKSLKKAGRKRQTFYLDFRELTDEYLEYLVDYDYMTISEIEKQVGAGKNQLRNRYNKLKRKKKLQKEVDSHDHS